MDEFVVSGKSLESSCRIWLLTDYFQRFGRVECIKPNNKRVTKIYDIFILKRFSG